jgi:hypothetical protein
MHGAPGICGTVEGGGVLRPTHRDEAAMHGAPGTRAGAVRSKEEPDPLARGQMRGFFAGRYATVLRMTPGVGWDLVETEPP